MIYLDIDGVLADFDQGLCEWMGENLPAEGGQWQLAKYLGFSSEDEFLQYIHDLPAEFWVGLRVLPWAADLVSLCRRTVKTVRLATAAVHSEDCVAGKIRWVRNHFPELASHTLMIRDKWMLAKPGRILIDDLETQCDRFHAHGGSAILFPQPWNKAGRHVDRRLEHVEFLLHGA